MSFYTKVENGYKLRVEAKPNSKKNEILGADSLGQRLRIRLKSPPVDGKANKDLVDFLSKTLKIAKTQIILVKGDSTKYKELQILTELDLVPFFNKFELVGP